MSWTILLSSGQYREKDMKAPDKISSVYGLGAFVFPFYFFSKLSQVKYELFKNCLYITV